MNLIFFLIFSIVRLPSLKSKHKNELNQNVLNYHEMLYINTKQIKFQKIDFFIKLIF